MNEHNCTSEYNEKAVSPRQHGQLMTAGSGATTLRASCRMDFLLLGCGFRSSGNDDSNGILRDFHGDSNGILLVIYD